MPILSYISELDTPTLIVAGENAHSLYFSQDAFSAINGDKKELVIIPNAVHTDLYDNTTGKIPFDKFEQFFKANL
ncbi:alpha/beta hydrolase [Campylobacter sp. CX2-8023-23]|nr:alpha/beta hydrolase [Campylobacter sp. CX2-8023-23]MEE3776902.1 alpha/beta hydrolase [Campylobacter sp. CX2-4080-23]